MATAARLNDNPVPSSSPAFGTPLHPFKPVNRATIGQPQFKPTIPTVLPILLPPPSLRPLVFRIFTKKHGLNVSSPALQSLATYIGRHCGSSWREEGTAEKVLEEVARSWKKGGGPVIVDDGQLIKSIFKTLEGCMSGGRIVQGKAGLSRQTSFAFAEGEAGSPIEDARPGLSHQGSSFGLSNLQVEEEQGDDDNDASNPHAWIKVVGAFEQPRLTYNTQKKHFERITSKPSLLPPPGHRTTLFRDRYNLIHQRVLRNPAFQAPSFGSRALTRSDSITQQQNYKITPIANLLGRTGSTHLLLGLLVVTPTGTLALNDMTGGITLDLSQVRPLESQDNATAWFCPGMIVLLEGVYQEEYSGAGASGLGGGGGVGGTIGGKFIGFSIGGPPCEKRNTTLGIASEFKTENDEVGIGGGFGWTDFLGLGSERATGGKMRRLERKLLSHGAEGQDKRKIVMLSEVNLDDPNCLEALRKLLEQYSADADSVPLTFVLVGNFVSHAAMAGGTSGSIEYKEYFNDLAAVLSDFPTLLRCASWVFVPGDNDPWPSAFSAGASTPIPRKEVPALFTSRIKRAFANAKAEGGSKNEDSEAVWTTNPSRLTLFGSAHEMVIMRDDLTGRLRRTAINFGKTADKDDEDEEMDNAASADQDIVMSGGLGEDDAMPEPESNTVQDRIPQASEQDQASSYARKLVLSILPQSHLSPFPLATRPVQWDYASALSLYPLPHTLVLADAEAPPFTLTYEGCHVMNPGRLLREEGRRKKVTWIEYDALVKRGEVKELWF